MSSLKVPKEPSPMSLSTEHIKASQFYSRKWKDEEVLGHIMVPNTKSPRLSAREKNNEVVTLHQWKTGGRKQVKEKASVAEQTIELGCRGREESEAVKGGKEMQWEEGERCSGREGEGYCGSR